MFDSICRLGFKPMVFGIHWCLCCLFLAVPVLAQETQSDSSSGRTAAGSPEDLSEALISAIAMGEIKVDLNPMVPSQTVSGIRWSPKGNKITLSKNENGLSGELRIGDHKAISLELTRDDSKPQNSAVLKIDLDHDGQFSGNEIHDIESSQSRGKFWFSAKATINLPVTESQSRPYPISLWYVVDPAESPSEEVIRWSRRGWHEGVFSFNGKSGTVVITDRDSDGVFTSSDAWGMGATPQQAYAHENSSNPIGEHAWLDSVAWKITGCDEQGSFVKIRAFDLGMTQAEDRERKDPYAADRKFKRSKQPVDFLNDMEQAKQIAKKSGKRILVDFVTTWCGPCHTMDQLVYTAQPVVEKSKGLVCVKLDGDEQKALNKFFAVKAYPTLILLSEDGEVLRKAVGYQSVKDLLEFLD